MQRALMSVIILISYLALSATEYVIGTGTSTQSRVPLTGANDYGWSKIIYTKAEINTAGLNTPGSIIGIGLYVDNLPTDYTFLSQSVFIRHTAAQSYTLANEPLPDSTAFTLVYRGSVTFHGDGWLQVAFTTPFVWDNNNSLELLWKNFDGSRQTIGYPQFRFTTTSPNYRAVYNNSDVSFPTSTGTRYFNRPNIQIITPMLPNPASVLYPSDAGWGLLNSSLRWKSGGGCPTTYDVYFGSSNPPTTLVSNDQQASSYTPSLAPNTTYYWKVVPQNASGNPASCPVWSFRTPHGSRLTESFEGLDFPPYDWQNPGAFSQVTLYPFHGTKSIYASVGTTGQIIGTPLLAISSGDQLIFSARTYYANTYGRVRVKYSADGSVWTTLGSALVLPSSTNWNTYSVDLSALAGNNYRLGLEAYSSSSSDNVLFYCDQIIAPPQAGQLSAPELSSNISNANIVLTWTAVNGATGYRVYASPDPENWSSSPLTTLSSELLSYEIPLVEQGFFRVTAIQE